MFATEIKIARIRKGIRQFELAHRIGVNESIMSRIETGRLEASEGLLKKIAEALEVNPDTLKEEGR